MKRKEHKFIDNIEHKRCSSCEDWLVLECFGKDSGKWDKLNRKCKTCINIAETKRNSTLKGRLKSRKQRTKYRNSPKGKKKAKEYSSTSEFKENQRKYSNRPEVRAHRKEYYSRTEVKASRKKNAQKPEVKARRKEMRNKPERIKKRREYSVKPEVKHRISQRHTERRSLDSQYVFTNNIRKAIAKAFSDQGYSKASRTYEILGAEFKEVFKYLKQSFTLNYYIEWNDKYIKLLHIDHILPLSLAKTEKDVIELNHYSNLQYLWSKHNMEKHNKTDWILTSDRIQEFKIHIGEL